MAINHFREIKSKLHWKNWEIASDVAEMDFLGVSHTANKLKTSIQQQILHIYFIHFHLV